MTNSFRKHLNISRLAINYPWLTISFWIGITVAGLFAFSSLKYALFPNVTFPVVIVNASSNLENIIETESKLTQPLEQSILSIEGIDQVYSSTFSGQTVINSLFLTSETLGSSQKKINLALEKVSLPANTSVEVIPFNLNESTALSYAITSKSKNLTELETITREKIIPPLEKIPGVLQVNLLGIIYNQDNNISNNSQNISTLVKFNGENSLAIQIVKKADANTLDIVRQVQQTINNITPEFPSIQLVLAQTEANFMKEATQSTIDALILAIILAVLVIFIFLGNFPATLITALAIPISLLGTCIVMAIANLNLETITLLALALVIGIVVDDAIVDIENIARHIEKGESPKQAAIAATDEIGLTVTASSLSIVAVFLPVALMGGTIGQFFKPFGLTVSAAVIISLLAARTLSPVLAVYWLKPRGQKVSLHIPFLVKFGKFMTDKYQSLLSWSLTYRKTVLLLAILSFVVGIGLIPFIPKGFIPHLDRGEFNIVYTTQLPKIPRNWSFNKANNSDSILSEKSNFNWLGNIKENPDALLLRRTKRMGEKIEKVLLADAEIESTFTVVGIKQQPNKGIINVKLKENRTNSTAKIKERIRNSLPAIKGTNISVEDLKFIESGDEKPIKFALISENLPTLYQTSQKVQKKIEKIPYLVDISSSEIQENIQEEKDILLIEHKNGKRATFISANFPEGEVIGKVTKKVKEIVKPMLPSNVELELEGDSARVAEIMADFGITLSISVALLLLVLLILFGRLLEPLVIGLSLPLSVVGAMLALLITRSDFGMISLIGLIFLLGLSDKNALLLVDYANQLRCQGMRRKKAILETGKVRLRPILMTSFSTILGMLPIALGWGTGSELRQPMAVAIMGGLLTSSILSLIFVPVFYTLLEDLWVKIFPKNLHK
jgi:multidrug efflux pump subunit AcrB